MRNKLTICVLALLLCSNYFVYAQSFQDVIHLKNGTMIKGLIIEQIPNESIKLQTKDGSVFAFQIDSVEKMTKEVTTNSSSTEEREDAWKTTPRYRGFVGGGYTYTGILKRYYDNLDYVSLWTSHGIQINPYIYAGGGIGGVVTGTGGRIAIFTHVRSDLHKVTNGRVAPYFDVKLGWVVWHTNETYHDVIYNDGIYNQNEIGVHFNFGHSKRGMSVGIAYNLQNDMVRYLINYDPVSGYYDIGANKELTKGLGLTISFDF